MIVHLVIELLLCDGIEPFVRFYRILRTTRFSPQSPHEIFSVFVSPKVWKKVVCISWCFVNDVQMIACNIFIEIASTELFIWICFECLSLSALLPESISSTRISSKTISVTACWYITSSHVFETMAYLV